ncbi:hypothetical protein COLO4_08853 [Corchorus olitorius]|uniref:Uncharacterized protein n=1 Tax=Corchorus olitorius TaxID=93759 RepID=A0A1R3KEF4_9ROSI|nr:hypothetical protein COLO4_08853 [Corchorus olitorius]
MAVQAKVEICDVAKECHNFLMKFLASKHNFLRKYLAIKIDIYFGGRAGCEIWSSIKGSHHHAYKNQYRFSFSFNQLCHIKLAVTTFPQGDFDAPVAVMNMFHD